MGFSLKMVRNQKRKQVAMITTGLLINIFVLISSCQLPTSMHQFTSDTTPQVEITELLALLVGKLELKNGCLVVKSATGEISLAWVPNLSARIDGNKVYVVKGMVQSVKREFVLEIGGIYGFGGGSTPLDEEIKKSIPSYCVGPYFVVANIDLAPDPKDIITVTPNP